MLNQYAVDNPTLPVNQCLSHLIQFPVECKAVLWECRAAQMGRQAFGTHMVYREKFFANSAACSSAPYPQELNPWSSGISEPIHTSPHVMSESQAPVQYQRCQSGPSAKNSVFFSGGDSPKNNGADQQRLQISDLHFDKFPTPATFASRKTRFKTEASICSQFPTEAMLWIKEVEMVDSVDDLTSSCSARGIRMPDFEVLDARIASALNRIIHNTQFKRKVSLEERKAQEAGPFPSRKTDRLLDRRVLPGHWSQRFCRELCRPFFHLFFEMMIFRNSIRNGTEFYLSITKIPSDDILEGLYKLRIRESEKLKTVLELYNMEIHQKNAGLDYHRLKTMVKRSIEQKLRIKNFEARNGNYERNAVVKNQGSQILLMQQDQKMRTRSPRGKGPSGRMSRWPARINYLEGTCTNSLCEKWHAPECLFYKFESGCRFGEKCSYEHRQVDEQPSKRSKKNGDKSVVAMLKKHELYDRTGRPVVYDSSNTRQLGCVFQDMEPP